jgi:hypothetical protein
MLSHFTKYNANNEEKILIANIILMGGHDIVGTDNVSTDIVVSGHIIYKFKHYKIL